MFLSGTMCQVSGTVEQPFESGGVGDLQFDQPPLAEGILGENSGIIEQRLIDFDHFAPQWSIQIADGLDTLAFANAGAYGVWSSPAMFHGSPLPAEVAFGETGLQLMRERKPAQSILDGQKHVVTSNIVSHS